MLLTTKRLVAAVAVCGFTAVAAPATSRASACGYEYWGSFTVKGISIPSGQLTHCISGKGYYVSWDSANFAAAGNLCDSSMRFTYGNGSEYFDGGVHWGCSHVGQWKYSLERNVPRGDACAELWNKNWRIRVARQCHYVS